jgi:[NiFe] hydrogenase diaphorase moiety large subunit
MLVTEYEHIRDEIRELMEQYGKDKTSIMPILQTLQKKYTYIPDFAMQEIAYLVGIHPVEVYGVVSFYSFLYERPQGKFIIRLCRTISCDFQGNDSVARQLENDLGIKFGDMTRDRMFKLEWTNCLGMCDQGPALIVNEKVYTRITPEKVYEIIQECRKSYVEPEHFGKEGR